MVKASERERLVKATRDYLAKAQALYATGQAREHAYRPAQIALFDAFEDVLAVNDAAKSDAGFPDFTFLKASDPEIVRGYGEGKDLGENLNKIEKSDQLVRYGSYDNLLLTNVLEVRFYSESVKCSEVELARLVKGVITETAGGPEAFVEEFAAFLVRPPEKIRSAVRLAEIMGGKARRIRKAAALMLADGDPAHADLLRVYELVKQTLSHEMTIEEFADMYAQTLVYGLFAARYHDPDLDTFSRQEARDLIGQENDFLRHFFDHIAGASFPDELRFVVNELCDVLRVSDVKKIVTAHLRRGEHKGRDPIIYFYELFLNEYDAEQRKDRGVYYTPTPVVRYIVRQVDAVLVRDFKLPLGLADSSKKKYPIQVSSGYGGKRKKRATPVIQERTLHRVQILDPAVGTATFLNETIRHIHSKFVNQQGLWPAYVKDDLIPRLHGFELMMAPYAIAHIKLAMTLDELGGGTGHQAGVYLTNSLDQAIELDHNLFTVGLAAAFSEEAHKASAIKVETPIMVVMGNPPYSGHSENRSKHATSLVDRYKVEPGGNVKLQEKNPKWLNDDYVKFISLAEGLVAKNPDGGVMAMITNNGFLDNPTFRGMRWHLAKTFDSIHVVDLHGSLKKKEIAPDGSKDENVFDIQQGVAILIAVKTNQKASAAAEGKRPPLAKVYHAELFGSRKAKFEALDGDHVTFAEVDLDPKFLFFQQRDLSGRDDYAKGVALNDCFNKGVVGLFTGRDSLTIDFDRQTMWDRVEDFISLDPEDARSKYSLGKDVRDWKVASAQADVRDGHTVDRLIPISYRPFDQRWTYYTGKARGFYYYPRDSVMTDLRDDAANLALVVGRQGAATGQGEWNLAFVARNVVDLNIFSRGGGYVFPRRVRDSSGSWFDNISPSAIARFGKSLTTKPSADDVFDYIYGVLNSPAYRASAAEFLKSDYPVIPLPDDDADFLAMVEFGRRVRELHLLEASDVQDPTQLTTTFPVAGSDVVGRRKYEDGKLFINDTQYVGNVSQEVWNYTLGGYQTADKWLKDRKCRKLSASEILHLQRMLTALALVVAASKQLP